MKTLYRFLLGSLLLCFLSCGCGKSDLRMELIGQWECTDFRWNQTRARNDAAKFTMVFNEDGTCISFWTDKDGSRYMESTNRFTLLCERVRLEDEKVVFRTRLRGDALTLVLEDSASAEDVGKAIPFRRQQFLPSVPHKR
ncbi:MAG: hypothetical protein ACP5MD_06035 [Verrucomicrobiia bacterium]